MKLFTRALVLSVLMTGALAAQDITGRWAGTAVSTDEGGIKREERQTLEIRMEDGKLTGNMIGRNGNRGTPFQVQQEGPKVNLLGFITFEGGEHFRWKIELKDGNLVGTFSAMHDSPKKWIYDRIGAITLTKTEAPPAK